MRGNIGEFDRKEVFDSRPDRAEGDSPGILEADRMLFFNEKAATTSSIELAPSARTSLNPKHGA